MPEKQPTEAQHFVPQTYLQGFSPDSRFLFEYNIKEAKPIDQPVSIRDICKKRYLYEVRDNSGEIVNINYLEDILCGIEGQFAENKRKLLRKVRADNFETNSFLTKEEKHFWTFYATVQLMRNPITLKGVKALLQESLPEGVSDHETYRFALAYCLPFFTPPEEQELTPFLILLTMLHSKALSVGFAQKDNLFTSDRAMYGSRNSKETYDAQSLWFPINSNCGLFFANPQSYTQARSNKLFPLTDELVRKLNMGIAYMASQMVLSKHPFSKDDIALIEEARMERDKDDQRKQGAKDEICP